jgi:hypothetical protein
MPVKLTVAHVARFVLLAAIAAVAGYYLLALLLTGGIR